MKRTKLHLSSETLRHLSSTHLTRVHGGVEALTQTPDVASCATNVAGACPTYKELVCASNLYTCVSYGC